MIRSAGNRPRSGLALLRKPEGLTSFQALYPIKRAVASGKIGHAGTLDRFARGLLVILVGSYSRLARYVVSGEKHYRGLISFGSQTDTLDPEGKVMASAPAPSREELESALSAFRGPILQRPPAYSAVHIGGKRAYRLALEGKDPPLAERRVVISSLVLLSYENGLALVEVRCSSGTYIRSLARDIALSCGSRAHLASLERLAIGPFKLEDAVSPEDFLPERDLFPFSGACAQSLGLRVLALGDEDMVLRFSNGGRVPIASFMALDGRAVISDMESAVYGPEGEFLGIVRLDGEGPEYLFVMPAAVRDAQ